MRRPALRRPPRRLPVLATALGCAALLTGCAGPDGNPDDDAAATPAVSATTAAGSPSPPGPSPSADDAQAISITVSGGEVTGVEPRTVVPTGSRVRLTITSDVADEVHVHGYDLTERLTVAQAVSLEFAADTPGTVEVEMHDAGTVLTRLQVQ